MAVVFGQLVNIQYGEHSKFTKAATDILEAGKNGLLTMFFSLILSHALDCKFLVFTYIICLDFMNEKRKEQYRKCNDGTGNE